LYQGHQPGLRALGVAMQNFYSKMVDKENPGKYCSRNAWSGAGARDDFDVRNIAYSTRQEESFVEEQVKRVIKRLAASPVVKRLAKCMKV